MRQRELATKPRRATQLIKIFYDVTTLAQCNAQLMLHLSPRRSEQMKGVYGTTGQLFR